MPPYPIPLRFLAEPIGLSGSDAAEPKIESTKDIIMKILLTFAATLAALTSVSAASAAACIDMPNHGASHPKG